MDITHEEWQRLLTERANETGRLYWAKIRAGICPVCDAVIEQKRKQWLYIFAVPCGHCLYQLKLHQIKKKEA